MNDTYSNMSLSRAMAQRDAQDRQLPSHMSSAVAMTTPLNASVPVDTSDMTDATVETKEKQEPMISISDPLQAIIQLVALVLIMMAVGFYIVVFKPGVPSQGLRALTAPNHPGVSMPMDSPAPVMAALAQTLG